MPANPQQSPKPRRGVTHRPKSTPRRPRPQATIEIEWIYQPDIERQMQALCLLLDIPYVRPGAGRAA